MFGSAAKNKDRQMVEFQLLDARIEDQLPDCVPVGADRDDIKEASFPESAEREKARCSFVQEGAVACLFGRCEDGKSVCVRVEGVKPVLYFLASGGESKDAIAKELAKEVNCMWSAHKFNVTKSTFAHFNGYEPDASMPSGRECHEYFVVEYPSQQAWRRAVSLRKEDPSSYRQAHEMHVHVLTAFFRSAGIVPGGWVRVEGERTKMLQEQGRVSSCDLEVVCVKESLHSVDKVDMSPYVILNYDAETLSLDPTPAENKIIQLSMVFETYGKGVDKHCVIIGQCDPLEGVTIHSCQSEHDFLVKVREIIVKKDPDFMVSYNGTFDNRYLATRAKHAKADSFFYFSRFAFRECKPQELHLASAGMGDNCVELFDAPGRSFVDYFLKFKIDFPSEVSWSLSHFCNKFLPGENKEPMDYREIPKLQEGSNADRRRLASYCVHDSYLLARLNEVRNAIVQIISYARVFGILPEWVYFRGQQVRFVSQVYEAARTLEEVPLLMQTPEGGFLGQDDDSGYKGATVNDPISGYYKVPIGTLDWASLYPSIMRAFNLCHSTHVRKRHLQDKDGVRAHKVRKLGSKWKDVHSLPEGAVLLENDIIRNAIEKKRHEMAKSKASSSSSSDPVSARAKDTEYDMEDVPMPAGLTVSHVVRTGEKTWSVPTGEHTTYFTEEHRGILPRVLEKLLSERKEAKKLAKEHTSLAKDAKSKGDMDAYRMHAAKAGVYESMQLAVKVSANSIYGATGAGKSGKMPNKDVSETVTFQGRETMDVLIDMLKEMFPTITIVYGDTDSVMVKFAGVDDLDECATLLYDAEKKVNQRFAARGLPQLKIEFEKIFFPYVLLRKKRYVGLKYEPTDDGKMECKGVDAKGVETERKDTLPFLKEIYVAVRRNLLVDMDEQKAANTLKEYLQKLVRNEVPFESLLLSKGLRSHYDNAETQVQWCVNEKKRKRQEGSQTASGDRVWYVIVNGFKNAKATELAEDPQWAKENNMTLNLLWYFEHKIEKPMQSLFKVIDTVDIDAILHATREELKRERLGIACLDTTTEKDNATSQAEETIETSVHVPRDPPVRRKRKARA